MPFYEYQCKQCGHSLEAMQKVNDAPLKKCPECGKARLERLMSAPVFRLKGGGWYETDFKGDKDNKRNLADRPDADAAKDEKKPAADAKADAAGTGEAAKPAEKAVEKASDKPGAGTAAAKPSDGASKSRRVTAAVKKPVKKAAAKKAKRR